MFKHLSKLFDYQELPAFINEYERLRSSGKNTEAAAVRLKIASLLADRHSPQKTGARS